MLSGGASARRYASSPDRVGAHQASTQLTAPLARKVLFNAGGTASYSPFFQFAPFLDPGNAVGPVNRVAYVEVENDRAVRVASRTTWRLAWRVLR